MTLRTLPWATRKWSYYRVTWEDCGLLVWEERTGILCRTSRIRSRPSYRHQPTPSCFLASAGLELPRTPSLNHKWPNGGPKACAPCHSNSLSQFWFLSPLDWFTAFPRLLMPKGICFARLLTIVFVGQNFLCQATWVTDHCRYPHCHPHVIAHSLLARVGSGGKSMNEWSVSEAYYFITHKKIKRIENNTYIIELLSALEK